MKVACLDFSRVWPLKTLGGRERERDGLDSQQLNQPLHLDFRKLECCQRSEIKPQASKKRQCCEPSALAYQRDKQESISQLLILLRLLLLVVKMFNARSES